MMLSFENVCKYKTLPNEREKKLIVSTTNFSLSQGDRVCILGDSKLAVPVLLRLITGAALPSSGKVKRRGRFSPPIGYVGSFHKELTGEENIKFTCKLYGQPPASVIKFVGDFIENREALKQPMKAYKDGLGKRIAFALSLAIDFDTYVARTPIASGSKEYQKKCMEAFTEKTQNSSLIVATNSEKFAEKHTTKALVITNGEVELFDSVSDGLLHFRHSNTEQTET